MDEKFKRRFGKPLAVEKGALRGVQTIKNCAELATLAGLFMFIANTYDSKPAFWVSLALVGSLATFITIHVNNLFLRIARPGTKGYVPLFILSVALGFTSTVLIEVKVMVPVLLAIEKQIAATPPGQQLPVFPAHAEIPAQPSAGTAAPKPVAVPSAEATAAPAPTVPLSVAPNRSSSPEARKPD
ncbi:hypothetical protein N5E02_04950 [Stenotrophomonas sp. GD03777]|uniref:hypothetical protein n=1 Tax=Stenotrophomonas sp. GD03777 TaxID=2975380 RepID=UPI0024498194|nr:hypothetical protein [Stenotrophomonas sp. GD03777]MDH1660762.1 hypothetical protein [Stenotrophomonas sp. GD03777]